MNRLMLIVPSTYVFDFYRAPGLIPFFPSPFLQRQHPAFCKLIHLILLSQHLLPSCYHFQTFSHPHSYTSLHINQSCPLTTKKIMGQSQSKPIKDKIRRVLTSQLPKSSKLRRLFKRKPKQDVSKYEQNVPIYFQKDSPLFAKLPQELRDMIYRHVLLSPGFLVVRNFHEPRAFVHLCRFEMMEGGGNGLRLLLERLPSDECPQFMGLLLSCRRA